MVKKDGREKKRHEGMVDIDYFSYEPSRFIYFHSGHIVCDPMFEERFDGKLRLLLRCIEDNIFIDEEGEKEINYVYAIEDYHNMFWEYDIKERTKEDL